MDVLEHMMKLYDEGLEELMDAQKYVQLHEKAVSEDERMMYRNLARQELEHAAVLCRAGDKLFNDHSDSLYMVWASLKQHLHTWRSSLETRLMDK